MSSSPDPSKYVESLSRIKLSTYVPASSACLFLYDYLLTFGDEITFVWKAPWSLGKVLFLLTRYPAFVDIGLTLNHNFAFSLAPSHCVLLYAITGWMFIIGMIIAEIILLLRVWALWGRTKAIATFLTVVSIIGMVITAVTYSKFSTAQTFIPMDSIAPSLPGCFPSGGTNIVFVGFLVLLSFETLIMILMLIKGVQHFRHMSSSFLATFYQDGIIYYALLLAVSISNVAVLVTGPPEDANLLTTLQRTLHSVLSARILLHLRQNAVRRVFMDGRSEALSVGSIVFAERQSRRNQSTQSRPANSIAWFGDDRPLSVNLGDSFVDIGNH